MTARRDHAAVTVDRLAAAFAARDVDGFRALLTEDAVVRSPYLTPENFAFSGRDQSALAVWALFHHLHGFVVTERITDETAGGLTFDAWLDGRAVRGALIAHLDEHARIRQGDLLMQDIVAVSRLGHAIAPRLLSAESRVLGAVVRPGARLLTGLVRVVDRVIGALLRRTVARTATRLSALPRPR